MKRLIASIALSCAALALPGPALANDSVASINLGGLELSPSATISMDSEDLYLSEKRIAVRYEYTNTGSQAEHLLISFPLPFPTGDDAEAMVMEGNYQDWDQLEFQTLIDGKPAPLERHDVPMVKGKSVEARLKELGWPVLHWTDTGLYDRLNALSDDEAAKLVAEGLLIDDAYYGGGAARNLRPAWLVQTHVTRHQTFPPGETVIVEHSYKPFVGGSATSTLNREYRADTLKGPDGLETLYCVDKPFLAGYDRRMAAGKGDPDAIIPVQKWFGYILKTGANWAGPIKKFRLVVDKGEPGSLVSFCMDGVKKISPTQFEVVRTNFEPDKDLEILLIDFIDNR